MSSHQLAAPASNDYTLILSLEASLQANGIQVAEGAVQQLLDKKEWIYPSKRVADLRKKLNEDQLYSVFNDQHHLQSATLLFDFLKNQDSCVVYGHKAQGKTQFLFFVFKLLQAMGEKVLFLDRTMLPLKADNMVEIGSVYFCGHLWRNSFQMDSVKTYLDAFFINASPSSFGIFTKALRKYSQDSRTRVWIIVDEVVLFENFPIDLPGEHDLGPFNWIVTGSAGIGSWVGKRHLKKLVFDLPLFTNNECLAFASRLCSYLNINLEDALGVPSAGIDDWLEERFGGVVGYIAEMLLEISQGNSASQYLLELSGRMREVIQGSATHQHISKEALVKDWINEIQSSENNWDCLRDAGLCGSSSPRGVIFTQILKWLFTFYVQDKEDELKLLSVFRSSLPVDPGLDGCLLELEEILKLKASHSMTASLLTLTNQAWKETTSIDLPSFRSPMTVLVYEESTLKLKSTSIQSSTSSWTLIEVPTGFDVIDVVLVNNTSDPPPAIYGIQITRSPKPFAKHYTFDTCHPRSSEKLNKLWSVISNHFKLDEKTINKLYVMLAPNCENTEYRPPAGHVSAYCFSPSSVLPKVDSFNSKKRSRRDT